jgi:hypothetical protein
MKDYQRLEGTHSCETCNVIKCQDKDRVSPNICADYEVDRESYFAINSNDYELPDQLTVL